MKFITKTEGKDRKLGGQSTFFYNFAQSEFFSIFPLPYQNFAALLNTFFIIIFP